MTEPIPFPRHPSFRRRGEYTAWMLRTFPNAPSWVFLAAAGDPAIYLREVEKLKLREVIEIHG